ncbi:mitochondrial carrier domain-containing protein [Protomyces lactucae-debilis]|uniref:Mitochondrial carrier domain-containing protein n=1 Tax=Protomyces lactucae-debilis TaxID=2754530 RepID=A0A1Y2FRE1_PROLT|nr:mitochondrial carrier domain-containing protein [Protomyces lactucae-debilis]ORY86147.1 mitochondrial carrier domain-containing protein [Protomyces lactucae-debilis]
MADGYLQRVLTRTTFLALACLLYAHAQEGDLITLEPELPLDGSTGDPSKSTNSGGGTNLVAALIAGAFAGLLVDLSLFPLDTIKTRLQSSQGFAAAGGLSNLYHGIGSIALGSAPSSALFFVAYEWSKSHLTRDGGAGFLGHLLATTLGEIASSLVRVPADVVKSRQQVEGDGSTATHHAGKASSHFLGSFSAFYTGWLSTLVREIPFGCIQFPLFSFLKAMASPVGDSNEISMLATALCGMVAGAAAGSLTTPLDVVKTRIMLAEAGEAATIMGVLKDVLRQEGPRGLFRGVVPRTLWIAGGGAIFLGGYDFFSRFFSSLAVSAV